MFPHPFGGALGSLRMPLCAFASMLLVLVAIGAEESAPSIEKLVERLNAAEIPVRRQASYDLEKLGPKAKPALTSLLKALNDSDRQVWSNSIAAIAAMGPEAKEAIPVLIEDLDGRKSRNQRSRGQNQVLFRTAYALTCIGPEAIPALIDGLKADNSPLRAGSARALGGMGLTAKEAIPGLMENLGHNDEDVHREVIIALAAMGAEAKPKLIEALNWDQARQRATAAQALAEMGRAANDAGQPILARLSQEKETSARISFLTALPKVGADPAAAVPKLLEGMRDSDEAIRRASINGLLTLRGGQKAIVESLTKTLQSPEIDASKQAADVLGRFGDEAVSVAPILVSLASKGNPPEAAYVDALVRIGEPALPEILKANENTPIEKITADYWAVKAATAMGSILVEPLRANLSSRSPAVRLICVLTLGNMGLDAASLAPVLMEKLDDSEVQVRAALLGALAEVSPEPKLLLPRIEKSLNDKAPTVRLAAAQLISKLGEPARSLNSALVAKVKDPDVTVRRGVLEVLGPGQAEAVPALISLLDDESMRASTVDALGRIGAGSKAAVPRLQELLKEGTKEDRIRLLATFGHIGESAKEAGPSLQPLRSDGDPEIRAAAVVASASVEAAQPARVALISTALDDPDAKVRTAAADATVALGDRGNDLAPKLVELIKRDADRTLALDTLRKIKVKDVNLLIQVLDFSQNDARIFACQEIGRLGTKAKDAKAALENTAKDRNDDVARSARRALRAISGN